MAPGIGLPVGAWRQLDGDGRFRALIFASALRFPDAAPLSHLSAAAMWGLPAVGPWPPRVETLTERSRGGRSRRGIVRHAHGVPSELLTIDGVTVTTLARTVMDAASILPFSAGVVMADHALRASRDKKSFLLGQLDATGLLHESELPRAPRGRDRSARVAAFADARAGSPAESVSRCMMHALGFEAPELQQEFRDADGLIGYADFWWPSLGLIGEFDGLSKYTEPRYLRGRSPSEVVVEEKIREDRLRALGFRVVRWLWDDIHSPQRLAVVLERAGLTRRRRFSATLG